MSFLSSIFGAPVKIAKHFAGAGSGGALPDISPAGPQNYIRNLSILRAGLRATAANAIGPAVQARIAEELTRRGLANTNLGRDLASGALTIPGLEVSSISSQVAPELQELQTAVASARAGIPRAPDTGTAVLTGAAQGFATGGLIGAAAGAFGGFESARSAQTSVNKSKKVIADATRLASPENFVANTNAMLGSAREQTFIESQQRELSQQASLAERGMTGTGIGMQESVSASVLPEVAALRKAASTGASITRGQTEARLGTPVRTPTDNLVKALTAAGIFAGQYFSPEATQRRQQRRQEQAGANSTIIQPTFMDQP